MMRHSINSLFVVLCLVSAATADGPFPPDQAAQHFTLPAGFRATLFAGEPDIVQPIAFTCDDRGRLWVVENFSYPGWSGVPKDRIVILEDRDGDGRLDERKVFLDNGSNLSGIELGFGGVWLCSTPNLVFVPDRNRDDVPDGQPVIKLDGWDLKAQHNVSSSLAWGPDGWLYGCNGILSNSLVGKPGDSPARRTKMNCGVWRYHPTRGFFEVVAHGTTNPWGLDFDQYGQTFITNCVIAHAWHVVPGARFERMFGQDFNPHSYALMKTCADHLHWAGAVWQEARGGERHHVLGGGHAHVGAMVYLGDNWPDEYRNRLFTCNLHGNRLNGDTLTRQGSGYVAQHEPDVMLANDPWFRGMTVKYGPDGGVYVSDWTDTGECHNYEVIDRSNGRIFKITHGSVHPWKTDLDTLNDATLVQLQSAKNDWIVRHARRILQERNAEGRLDPRTRRSVASLLEQQTAPVDTLRILWALQAIGGADESILSACLDSPHDVVRGWAVQLEVEDHHASPQALAKMAQLATTDASSWVRMALASALQRLKLADRWAIVDRLAAHTKDGADINLSLMYWYAIEPLVTEDRAQALRLARQAEIPLVRQYIIRCAAEAEDAVVLDSIVRCIAESRASFRTAQLAGLIEALQGRRKVAMPTGWSSLYAQLASTNDDRAREQASVLGLIFGDPQSLAELRKTAADANAEPDERNRAILALSQSHVPDLARFLQPLLTDVTVRTAALRGLAAERDATTPEKILGQYRSFDAGTRREAISVLASRREFADALLQAMEDRVIPRSDMTAFHAQQLQSLRDSQIDERLAKLWGAVRLLPEDRAALVAQHKARLTPAALELADLSRGRALFDKTCAACHRLFDSGGKIGPDLTGSQRANLDYLLSNVLDPSAMVAKEYQLTVLQLADGRILSGIVLQENEHSVTVQTANEQIVVPRDEIELREPSEVSMMPDRLLNSVSDADMRDLVGYLASPQQVPLPENEP